MAYNPGQELSSLAFDKIIGGALDAVIKAQNNSSMTTVNFIKEVGFNSKDGEIGNPVYVDFKYPKEVAPYQPATEAYCTLTIEDGGAGYKQETVTKKTINGKEVKVTLVIENGKITDAAIDGFDKDWNNKSVEIESTDSSVTKAKITCKIVEAQTAKPAVYQDMTLQVPILTMLPIPFIRIQSADIEFNVKINSISTTESSSETSAKADMNAKAAYKSRKTSASVEINASVSHQKKNSSTEQIQKEYSLNIKVHAVQDEVPTGMSRILDILEESIVPKLAA